MPFKLAAIESELEMSRHELHDIINMYTDAEESRQRYVVGTQSVATDRSKSSMGVASNRQEEAIAK